MTFREISENISVKFDGHFKKNNELGRNFETRTVSLSQNDP